jgi:hypothetical protein
MRIAFDRFVFDTGTRELRRDGRPVDLTPKAFELLALLIANRPRVISKTELQERLWPDRFVVDKNLANLVSEIRDALGDTLPTRASSGPPTGSVTHSATAKAGSGSGLNQATRTSESFASPGMANGSRWKKVITFLAAIRMRMSTWTRRASLDVTRRSGLPAATHPWRTLGAEMGPS